jgi:hypothetical protein
MVNKLKRLFMQVIMFILSPPWDDGIKARIAIPIRKVYEPVCLSSLGPLFNLDVQYHVEDAGFTSVKNTCWTTNPEKGCKKNRRKNPAREDKRRSCHRRRIHQSTAESEEP